MIMNSTLLISLAIFSIVTSITPGPNNIMLLVSGMNFGLKRTLPHSLGITCGFFVLLLAVGAGVGSIITASPILFSILKWTSAAYLLYLAYCISMSRSMNTEAEAKNRPLTFFEAALFQWVNPKSWIMAISGMALYTNSQNPVYSVLFVAIMFGILNWPCVIVWAAFGAILRKFLSDPQTLKWFNIFMGIMMAGSVAFILI